jgi:hypothetical protein
MISFLKFNERVPLKIGISLLFVAAVLSDFKFWGNCNYFSFQFNLPILFLACFALFIFLYLFTSFIVNESWQKHLPNQKFKILIDWFFSFILFFCFALVVSGLLNFEVTSSRLSNGPQDKWLYIFVFSILASAFSTFLKKNGFQILTRFFGFVGFIFFSLYSYKFLSNYECMINHIPLNAIEFHGKADRQVIWVIFDEFDPKEAFDNPELNETLVNFNTIRSSALFNIEMFPPGMNTIESVPASIMSKTISKRERFNHDGRLWFYDGDGKKFEFTQKESIFESLDSAGFDASIFGFYHPYCRLFKDTDCRIYSDTPTSWFDGITRLPLKFIFKFFPSQQLIPVTLSDNILAQQLGDLNNFVTTKKQNLLYIHLMAPHMPAIYAQQYFSVSLNDEHQKYLLNIRLTDKILGDILNAIPQDGRERLLILDSDHWNRSRGEQPHPSLSIVKIMSDNKALVNPKPTSRIYTAGLILDFLNGKIKSNQDLMHYYSNKTYHDTYIHKP